MFFFNIPSPGFDEVKMESSDGKKKKIRHLKVKRQRCFIIATSFPFLFCLFAYIRTYCHMTQTFTLWLFHNKYVLE